MKKDMQTKTKRRTNVDFPLLITVLMLIFIGLIMVFSASWPEAQIKGDSYSFLRKQAQAALIGLFIMLVAMNINYKIWKKYSLILYVLSLGTVALLIPYGVNYLGATRWVSLGGLTFMPGDVVKAGSIIYFSAFLSYKKNDVRTLHQGYIPIIIFIGISLGSIIIQNDLGTTITLGATLAAMWLVAGMHLVLIPLGLGAVSLVGYKYYQKLLSSGGLKENFRLMRILSFLDPFEYSSTFGFQTIHSLYALGTGGLFGLGLGKSKQKFFYLPEPYNDFIFAIIGEEVGFVGVLLVIMLYIILVVRGIKIAMESDDLFGFYLATGITALIAIQSIIHIAVVTNSIPTTGITLPFISYGGTSLIIYMGLVGVLLNISKHKK